MEICLENCFNTFKIKLRQQIEVHLVSQLHQCPDCVIDFETVVVVADADTNQSGISCPQSFVHQSAAVVSCLGYNSVFLAQILLHFFRGVTFDRNGNGRNTASSQVTGIKSQSVWIDR